MTRIILCTGIDGEAKRGRIQEIIDSAPKFYPGTKIHLYSVGDKMSEVAGAPRESLLDDPRAGEYRKEACKRILKAIKQEEERVGQDIIALIATRACYYHRSVPVRSLDDSHKRFKPEFCVHVIDDIQDMAANMSIEKRWRTMGIWDFLRWRDFEMKDTEEWAKGQGIATYILPVKEPSKTLLDLLFANTIKVYLSFPITHAPKEMRKKKDEFAMKLRKQFIVFDPLSIMEYDRAKKEYEDAVRKYEVSRKQEDKKNVDELERLKVELGNQTVARDFKIINQSNAIVVYYTTSEVYVEDPEGETVSFSGQEIKIKKDEGVFLSAGVINEMVWATINGKKTYAIWSSKKDPSPFFSYHCEQGRLFKGPEAEKEFWESDPRSFIK